MKVRVWSWLLKTCACTELECDLMTSEQASLKDFIVSVCFGTTAYSLHGCMQFILPPRFGVCICQNMIPGSLQGTGISLTGLIGMLKELS